MSHNMYDNCEFVSTNTNASISIAYPSEDVKKQVYFLINNLSEINISYQIEDICSLIQPDNAYWFGELLVKRAGSEVNLQQLYSTLIENLKQFFVDFDVTIIEILKRRCDLILKSDIDSNTLKILKNYGSFLGMLTLSRDIHICLDLKGLLKESYQQDKDSLSIIVPFVCQILRGLKSSKTITKHHSWSQELIGILKEIYNINPDKLNLQFEIEILFKTLAINIQDIQPAFFMRLSSQVYSRELKNN